MSNARRVKRNLNKCIQEISLSSDLYCRNPGVDFSRKRKLPFAEVMKAILCFSGKSLNKEMIEIFGCKNSIASVSAFVQQREKIKAAAFEALFHQFTEQYAPVNPFSGYRLIAVDGSHLIVPTNPDDKESLFQINGATPYNLYHLNALFDIGSGTYIDAIVQKGHGYSERRAFIDMIRRLHSSIPSIFLADRGFESFNNMAHVQELGQYFLFRLKDSSGKGLVSGFDLTQYGETFDVDFDLNLTRKSTNYVKELCKDKNHYKILKSTSTFDFLPKKSRKSDPLIVFNLKFRLVRIEISDGKYEVIATNLNRKEFPPKKLKEIYALRWGIETSFRHLKYALTLNNFHSKKEECILQEIFAKLTMYNFIQTIASQIIVSKKDRKYTYQINFSIAVHTCRNLLLGCYTPKDVEAVIQRHILPIRIELHKPRCQYPSAFVSFSYRLT